jgi:phosphoglycerate dehydrogenase-like enzyme
VGFNNLALAAAIGHGIAMGKTPGVLTETTAELAVALTFAAVRRIDEVIIVEHCRSHPEFRAGLDGFEENMEPVPARWNSRSAVGYLNFSKIPPTSGS